MNHQFLHTIDVGKPTLPAHLETLKAWLERLPSQFNAGAPPPNGTLLYGLPGSGKGIIAAGIAEALARPLFRLDPACELFAVAEIVGLLGSMPPVVLLVNEPGEQHRGLVQWLLEQPRPVFLIATTMRPNKLRAGFFRRDLFDTAWHLDLPTSGEPTPRSARIARCRIRLRPSGPVHSPVHLCGNPSDA